MAIKTKYKYIIDGRNVVFNIGYQGRMVDEFILLLKTNEITQLVDLREKPYSRIKGFSKNVLAKELEKAGITYCWMGSILGGLTCDEQSWKTGCQQLAEKAETETLAIMCMERDVKDCHRMKLAEMLAADHKIHNINL